MKRADRLRERNKRIIDRFHEELRSGKDLDVESIYTDIAEVFFISKRWVQQVVNSYYRDYISCDMIVFTLQLSGDMKEKIDKFSGVFGTCERESRLIIRYVKIIANEKRNLRVDSGRNK